LFGPAATNSVLSGWLAASLPNAMPHRPGTTIAAPVESVMAPMEAPLAGSKPWIVPSPRLPTSSVLLSVPKFAGASGIEPRF
jgi:hypothetical protein